MRRYYYEPGNGTRYDLLYGKLEGSMRYVIAWMHDGGSGGSCLRWQHWDDLRSYHWSYIAEKMRIREADARAIAKFMESHHATRVAENKEDEG